MLMLCSRSQVSLMEKGTRGKSLIQSEIQLSDFALSLRHGSLASLVAKKKRQNYI